MTKHSETIIQAAFSAAMKALMKREGPMENNPEEFIDAN